MLGGRLGTGQFYQQHGRLGAGGGGVQILIWEGIQEVERSENIGCPCGFPLHSSGGERSQQKQGAHERNNSFFHG